MNLDVAFCNFISGLQTVVDEFVFDVFDDVDTDVLAFHEGRAVSELVRDQLKEAKTHG